MRDGSSAGQENQAAWFMGSSARNLFIWRCTPGPFDSFALQGYEVRKKSFLGIPGINSSARSVPRKHAGLNFMRWPRLSRTAG
jgi:hypothetical protein